MPDLQSPRLRQRVLLIGPSNIGDGILIADVLARLRRRFPEAHLTVVVGERARALFAEDPRIQTLVDAGAYDSWLGRLKLAAALWRYQPHVVVDLRHTLYPLLLKPLTAWRYLRQAPRDLQHMRSRHLWKLNVQAPAAGRRAAPEDAGEPPLWFSARDEAHVAGLCRRWGLDGSRRLVVVCPGARSHLKRWTAEGFARVADRLIGSDEAEVVLCGEPEEKAVVEDVVSLMSRRAHTAVGLTTIRQLGALIRRAALVVTNDSAALHLASALRVPTVAVFGPTDDAKYGPTAPRRRTVRRRLFCAPCEQAVCRFHHECMRFISDEDVYHAAHELLLEGAQRTGPGDA